MSEYVYIRSNGQITLPVLTRRKAKLKEGDLLEIIVEAAWNDPPGSQTCR